MFMIYIAKATENSGLLVMHPIYECALEVLPNHQMAQMCLQFTAHECKLGESIVHVLFMPMHLSSVICVWRPNSGLSEIPLKLKQGVGTLSMKCFTLNVVSRLSSALLCPIWWLKLRAQSHQTLSKML